MSLGSNREKNMCRHAPIAHEAVGSDVVLAAKRIWNLRRSLWRAEWVVDWVDEEPSRWHHLSASDKNLYDTFQALQTELADVLKTPAGERYRGSGSYMNQMPALTGNP